MESTPAPNRYFIWGIDESPYGPVPVEALAEWITDQRVLPETWVFARNENRWAKAADLPELKTFFSKPGDTAFLYGNRKGFKPGSLRRIKILAELTDPQLAHLSEFLELKDVPIHSVLFNQGDAGDSMYFILGGELRVRTVTGGRESILATLSTGDFFGEMAIFDKGPRSAGVVANADSTMLRLSAADFQRMLREAPSLAIPFFQATSRSLSARIRANNKQLTRITEQFSAYSGR